MSNDFVHLHTHSEYSLLDGLGRIKKLVGEAKRLGQPALALTDHGVMHGAIEFFRACRDAEIRPIIGLEAYQTLWGRPMDGRDVKQDRENYHLLLLARNMAGYRNLLHINSNSHLNGYYYKPRIDHDFLAAHAEGLIATTGCLGAEVPQLLMQGKEREAYERLGWYADVFGKDNFFIELQEHNIPELIEVNKVLVPWADKFGLKLLATNDVHYVREEDGGPHDVLLCVQTGTTVDAQDRMRLSDASYFLKSRQQMEATFRPFIDLPASAFDNTVLVAEMCEVDLEDREYHLPDLPIPEGFTYATYLRHLTEEGLQRLYGERANEPEVQERKERELRIIHEMGFDVYFLIVADLCDFARSRNIWWNVRGSGAGSLVAYCTGITGIDPLKNNLIFERFLNPGRVTMPDFDLDYPDDQREEMIRYTVQKYGEEQVAQIATFGRMKARAAIRDVGRATGVELHQVDRIAKLIPAIPGKPVTIQDVLTEGHEFYNPELVELHRKEKWVQDLLETSMKLEGVARHSSVHAAAVIVADKALTHYTPLMRGNKNTFTSTITQYEFPILESIGLLKVDFLGLSTLSVMREAGRLIRERHSRELTLETIPFEGEEAAEAFRLLSSGEVSGVFQVESQGMRRVLTEMRPNAFEHIVATISLYRPGPLEYIPQFIRRMHGEEEVEFKHPTLASILAETYGIIVYQEQIIQILSQLAGYTPGDADLVRRAISKKKASDIEYHKKLFIEGCARNGIPKDAATATYNDIEFFARYGFNKCLPGDVEVLDATTGDLVRMEDLYTGRARLSETVTCDTGTLRLGKGAVSQVMYNGVKPVYRLTTALGRTIEATDNHPFFTFNGWRLLGELKPGQQIATPRSLPVEGQETWPEHQVIVLGHLLAEGNLCHPHSVYYYSQDPQQCQDYVVAAEQFANTACTVRLHRGTYSIYARRVVREQPPEIVDWAKTLGIWGKDARAKSIPAPAFRLNNRQIGLLLSRMWEGDGHLNTRDRSVYYATASQTMARQMQHLLLRLGIISRLRTVEFPYKEGRTGYQLFITGAENLRRFVETVGGHFLHVERRRKLAELATAEKGSAGVKDVVPLAIKETVRRAKDTRSITWDQLNLACGVAQREFYPSNAPGKQGYARATIARLADYLQDDELARYAHSDLYWDRIIAIDYVGEKPTYDLEVPHTHNFVANDILVHNSHAADYAVICVQTAYLKAHYPVEYMAALLLIERDKTEKVVNFINECRRMGIDVLPPDVNYSGLDFDIQARPEETPTSAHRDPFLTYDFPVPEGSAIRFGMAAVKNVGEGPVKVILAAREQGGPFTSLEDFCDRVDLRAVNKRSLECLFKVGAFDRFGTRNQLLAILDQMVAHSAGVHDARDSGQLSMFDLMGQNGAPEATPIRLPAVAEESGRERLQWEKELLGVYAMSHPMNLLSVDLQKIVTCACNELDARFDGKHVMLAGMIAGVRTITTKKGDPMAFVQLEDLQGQCEVVVFPRTYAEVKELLTPDSVVVVKGVAQTREGQTSLLADSFQTYVDEILTSDEEFQKYQQPLIDVGPTFNGRAAAPTGANGYALDALDIEMIERTLSGAEDGLHEDGLDDSEPADEPDEDRDEGQGRQTGARSAIDPATSTAPASNSPITPPISQDVPPGQDTPSAPAHPPERVEMTHDAIPQESVPQEPPGWLADDEDNASYTPARPEKTNRRNPAAKPAAGPKPGAHQADSPQPPRADAPAVSKPAVSEPSAAYTPADNTPTDNTPADNTPTDQDSAAAGKSAAPVNGHTNGHTSSHANGHTNGHPQAGSPDDNGGNGHSTTDGDTSKGDKGNRVLEIQFRSCGDVERDKYRLRQIYESVRDPKGRDQFVIVLQAGEKLRKLAFPQDPCSITDRLVDELGKYFRVDARIT